MLLKIIQKITVVDTETNNLLYENYVVQDMNTLLQYNLSVSELQNINANSDFHIVNKSNYEKVVISNANKNLSKNNQILSVHDLYVANQLETEKMNIAQSHFASTFFDDFSFFDRLGAVAVQDNLNRTFQRCKNNYLYLTWLVKTLNQKMKFFYAKKMQETDVTLQQKYASLFKVYSKKYEIIMNYALEKLRAKELLYFNQILNNT